MGVYNAITSLYQACIVRGLLPGHQALPFIVAAGPRSGSTLLQEMLHSHRNAVCMHELLLKSGGTSRFRRYNLTRREQLARVREQDMNQFFEAVLLDPQPPWVEAVGFKAMYKHPREEKEERLAAWEMLGEIPELHVIWLQRNIVRRLISFSVALETEKWKGEKTTRRVHVDPNKLLRRLESDEQKGKEARGRVKDCELLDVQYESLTESPEAVLTEIQSFLDLPPLSLHSSLTLQNPRTIEEMVANFDEVKRALMDTRWESAFVNAAGRRPKEI